MHLGFVSAIMPDLGLEEVMQFAADNGFDCVEVMCWPKGPAERLDAPRSDRICTRRISGSSASASCWRFGWDVSSVLYFARAGRFGHDGTYYN